jgi:antirestriction protein
MSTDMRVWVGCLGCYNAGYLIGEWVDAAKADTITVERLAETMREGSDVRAEHLGTWHPAASPHEELWCMDTEGLAPFIDGECSPMAAQQLAEQVGDLEEHELRLLRLYVEALGRSNWSGDVDWAEIAEEAREHYVGEGTSLEDVAQGWVEEMGLLDELSKTRDQYGREKEADSDSLQAIILRNIDWRGVTQEIAQGWSDARDDDGTVVVFHD